MLLEHVYSDCLQNVATNTKNKPFSGFGPWPISLMSLFGRHVNERIVSMKLLDIFHHPQKDPYLTEV